MSGFAFDGVTAIRRGQTLFEALSFALMPGDAVLVTGANGAGKSTLLRIAAGLLPPSEGRVTRGGSTMALLAEASALDADRSLAAALRYWAMIDGSGDIAMRVDTALCAVDLLDLAEVPVRLLSTGQRRRAAMARVLGSCAALWLLDEPANGLDRAALLRLEAAIASHRAGGGMAIVATHQPVELTDAREIRLGAS